ncbi:MAG: S-layer homology domain-containing protein, partial [Eubacteriales bacterium]|nr:S-layer homology domain-containing protein [Eubacteriales bacterium]
MKQNKSFFKRILSLVTAIMILASVFTFGTVFAYTPSMNDDSVSSLLKSLNIIDFSIDQPDSTSTRENFAVYVANMLNIGESTTSKRYFADVENTAYSSKAINTLAEMGIISAAADKYFNPGAKITMSEALKMLVCAVGAKGYA